jgi:hypothetical protein
MLSQQKQCRQRWRQQLRIPQPTHNHRLECVLDHNASHGSAHTYWYGCCSVRDAIKPYSC